MLRVRVLRHVECESDLAILMQVEAIAREQFPLATVASVTKAELRY